MIVKKSKQITGPAIFPTGDHGQETEGVPLNLILLFPFVDRLVFVPVVKIWPVGMSVDQGIVNMPMAMPAHTDSWGVFIVMMLIVEPVPVIMLDLGV